MKKIYLFLLLLIGLSSCDFRSSEQAKSNEEELLSIIDSIKRRYAPDPRDHVWEISMESHQKTYRISGVTDLPEAKDALLETLKRKNIPYHENIRILPAEKWKNLTGVIRLSVANVRSQPRHSAELSTQLFMGMPVQILEQKDDFYRIRTPSGYLGWTDLAALVLMDRQDFNQWLRQPKIIVQAPYARLTEKTDPASGQVSDAVQNDVAVLLSQGDYFHHIMLPDGRKAYIGADKAVTLEEWHFINSKLFDVKDMIQLAKTDYMGIPYLWGGTSIKGLDCSGFTKSLFHNFGILLPRDASQQFKIGKDIPLDDNLKELQPGDLLFFGSKNGDKVRITHVAFYTGNGRIIHATGEVKEESLWSEDSLYNPKRRKSLQGAKRILGYYNKEIYPYYKQK